MTQKKKKKKNNPSTENPFTVTLQIRDSHGHTEQMKNQNFQRFQRDTKKAGFRYCNRSLQNTVNGPIDLVIDGIPGGERF